MDVVQEAPAQESETTQAVTEQTTTSFTIPDEYKDKPWVGKVKDVNSLFKMYDDVQPLLGKKYAVPDWDNATDKDVEDYLSAHRADEDTYKSFFEEGAPNRDEFAKLFHESGVPKPVAKRLIDGYLQMENKYKETLYSKEGFFEEMKNSFGETYEKEVGKITNLLNQNVNQSDKALLEELPNQYLGLIYRIVNNFDKEYGASELDGSTRVDNNRTVVDYGKQIDDIRQQIFDLSKRPHTAQEKSELISKLEQAYNNKNKGVKK